MTISLSLPEKVLIDLANRFLTHQDNALRLESLTFAEKQATIATNRGTFEVSGITFNAKKLQFHSVRTIISILGFKKALPASVQSVAFNAMNRNENIHITGQMIEIDLSNWWPAWLPNAAYEVVFVADGIVLKQS